MRARRVDRVLARKAEIGRYPVRTSQPARRIAGRRAPGGSRYVPATDHPTEGSIRIVRPPVRFGEADCALRRPAPRLGEHSREILREAGFGDDKIADLLARKVAVEAFEM